MNIITQYRWTVWVVLVLGLGFGSISYIIHSSLPVRIYMRELPINGKPLLVPIYCTGFNCYIYVHAFETNCLPVDCATSEPTYISTDFATRAKHWPWFMRFRRSISTHATMAKGSTCSKLPFQCINYKCKSHFSTAYTALASTCDRQ